MVSRLRVAACEHARIARATSDNATRRRHHARALYVWRLATVHRGTPVSLPRCIWDYLASPGL